jgi:Mrp family chromosome partitioning ATPase
MSRIDEALRRTAARVTDTRGVLSVAGPLPQRAALEQFPLEGPRAGDDVRPEAPARPAAPIAVNADIRVPLAAPVPPVRTGAPSADVYRRLAAQLTAARQQRPLRAVMLSSAVRDEGHATIALDLATALCGAGRVLLVDADLDAPSLHDMVRAEHTPGGVELLAAGPRAHALTPVGASCSVLTAGRLASGRVAGPASEWMSALVDEYAEMFHWVVLLPPPLSLLPDAALLARRIGSVVYVIGARTPFAVAQRTIASIDRELVVGTVLSGFDDTGDATAPRSD